MFYARVEDIAMELQEAMAPVGKLVVSRVDLPDYGSFAWFTDPDGNTSGCGNP